MINLTPVRTHYFIKSVFGHDRVLCYRGRETADRQVDVALAAVLSRGHHLGQSSCLFVNAPVAH